MADHTIIDVRGYSCTGALMELIAALKLAQVGDEIEVLSIDPNSAAEILEWVRKVGHDHLGTTRNDELWRVRVRKAR
jgi:TusA-related sulfurtransferase